jgi:lipopolysaccharide biosynthesis glycosyltransferase
MKVPNRIDIVFGIDEAYVEPLMVVAYSVVKNNKTFDEIGFHILTGGLSDTSRQEIRSFERIFSHISFDFSIIDDSTFRNFPLNIKHIAPIAYGRFLIPIIFQDADKMLYLDADLIVLGDLGELWATDTREYCAAGSHKQYINDQFPGYKELIGLNEDSTYINSGVMLLNLKRMRRLDMTQRLLSNAQSLRDIVRIQDQDIINVTLNNEITRFDKKYNYTDSDRREGTLPDEAIVIAHFNTGNKPWLKDFVLDKTNETFARYYQELSREVEASKL